MPTQIPKLTPEAFEALFTELQDTFGTEASTQSKTGTKAQKLSEAATRDPLARYLNERNMIVGPANKDGGLPISCPWRDAHTTGDGGAMYWPAHTGGYARGHFKCMHAHCEKRTDKEFADAIGFTAGNDVLSALILAGEIGLSEKFAERYADSLRYVTKLKRWYVWDGMRWKEDTKGEAKLAAKAFCDEIAALVREGMPGEDEDPTRRRAIVQAARYFESAHMVGAVLDLANCEPALVLDVEMLDRDDLLFNTPVGTVDLRTDRAFIGRPALEAQRAHGGVLRSHMEVATAQGPGMVTSGTFAPTLGCSIALARLPAGVAAGDTVSVQLRGAAATATVCQPPFVRNGRVLVQ